MTEGDGTLSVPYPSIIYQWIDQIPVMHSMTYEG